jgi:hypothetical protein
MYFNISHVNKTLHALPVWAKLVIATQCLLPGVVMWFQIKFVAYKSAETVNIVDIVQKIHMLPEAQYGAFVPLVRDALQAGAASSSSFFTLVLLNAVLAVLGLIIVIPMIFKQKPASY